MYLSYNEFVQFGGTLDSAAFPSAAFEACKMIDSRTFGRLKTAETVSETVKRLIVALVERKSAANAARADNVSSTSNDGVSVSYRAPQAEKDTAAELNRLIELYLSDEKTADGTPLLYAGV